ncbi:oleosin H1-like [Actinidia eriantha]|uniref:oleosin H1-like n=1 Tax=Actinidia eriantha TaxID=165200 RepID=UPI002586EFE4|nr:oleosin H1-like [Actinidia eriantha]
MADRPPHQLQVHPQHRYEGGFKAQRTGAGPPASKILAVLSLLPVGGTLLGLAGVTLAATLVGLAVAAPLFLIFSPVLVPAAGALGLAVAGFIVSGAFGLTGLTSMSWVVKQFRQGGQLDEAKRRMEEVAVQMGQKTKEMGEAIENKAKEAGK